MKNRFSTRLSGQIGESLCVAELGRRGIIATTFTGNVPDIDVLAYRDGISVPIQVKAQRRGNVSVNATRYLEILFDGDIQRVEGKTPIDRNLIFVFVFMGEKIGGERFYVCKQGAIQDIIFRHHKGFLNKHGGKRPRNPSSTHCSYYEEDLSAYRDNWALIEDVLGSQA